MGLGCILPVLSTLLTVLHTVSDFQSFRHQVTPAPSHSGPYPRRGGIRAIESARQRWRMAAHRWLSYKENTSRLALQEMASWLGRSAGVHSTYSLLGEQELHVKGDTLNYLHLTGESKPI
ncbi:hypothetical protein E2C01_037384 [Portunus trituberculatus]|uniref:Uncharacterized protein n=1 Tax=Portunus trituberculatus TaxID=210409 RepID=A0A5B7FBA0_PORTR|nr:hypothetical protein [Portunus trituberculatus]